MYLKTIELMHWLNLSVMGNQFRVYEVYVSSYLTAGKKPMHLFWGVWILFFNFLVKLVYQTEQA